MIAMTLINDQLCLWISPVAAKRLHSLDHVLAQLVGHAPEHNVLAVEPVVINYKLRDTAGQTIRVIECCYQFALLVVMKNCDPLVFGPELAMERIPGPACFSSG